MSASTEEGASCEEKTVDEKDGSEEDGLAAGDRMQTEESCKSDEQKKGGYWESL